MKAIILIVALTLVGCGAKHEDVRSPFDQGLSEDILITFDDHIRPLFEAKCKNCHGRESSMLKILDYETSVKNIDIIHMAVVETQTMPDGIEMSRGERGLVTRWLNDGLLKNNANEGQEPMPEEPPKKELKSFAKDIQPLFEQKCSACHNESSSLLNVNNYNVAVTNIDKIFNAVVTNKTMPIGGNMSYEERNLITVWMNDGLVESTD